MDKEHELEILESHRLFTDGAFGMWLEQRLGEKVNYWQSKVMQAACWDAFVEARANYEAANQLYNMVVNPDQFF